MAFDLYWNFRLDLQMKRFDMNRVMMTLEIRRWNAGRNIRMKERLGSKRF